MATKLKTLIARAYRRPCGYEKLVYALLQPWGWSVGGYHHFEGELCTSLRPRNSSGSPCGLYWENEYQVDSEEALSPTYRRRVNKFNALASDESVASAFLRGDKPGYEGFVRAMNLFSSLRVGETPTRYREKQRNCGRLQQGNYQGCQIKDTRQEKDLAPAASKLKQYIDFAEQHVPSHRPLPSH